MNNFKCNHLIPLYVEALIEGGLSANVPT